LFARRKQQSSKPSPAILSEANTSEQATEFQIEWGISLEQEKAKVQEFRQKIEAKTGKLHPRFDDFYLRRFVRARQHDITRASEMFFNHLQWREANGMDTIMEDFYFDERDAFLTLYPQGYHMTDKVGRPIYIQHLGQINVKALQTVTTVERMVKYHIQEYERALKYIFPACSKVAHRHIDQTLTILDLKGVGLRHLTGDVKRILSLITRVDQDNYPETLGKTIIINSPSVFKMIWGIVKPMLDVRTQKKIEVAPSDFLPVVLKYADAECIPEYLGGKSKASLLDDIGPWNDGNLIAEIEGDYDRLLGREGAVALHPPPHVREGTAKKKKQEEEEEEEEEAEDDEFYETLSRRQSFSSATSMFMSADEGESPTSGSPTYGGMTLEDDEEEELQRRQFEGYKYNEGRGAAGGRNVLENGVAQIPIIARVRALEEHVPQVERGMKKYLPSSSDELPSKIVGQGTLASRISALERAMETLLEAQQVSIQENNNGGRDQDGNNNDNKSSSSCCACCTIM